MKKAKAVYWNEERESWLKRARRLRQSASDSQILFEALRLAVAHWESKKG